MHRIGLATILFTCELALTLILFHPERPYLTGLVDWKVSIHLQHIYAFILKNGAAPRFNILAMPARQIAQAYL